MAIQPVPAMTPVPHFPALSERAAGTYNQSAYNFGTHMSVTFNGELLAVAMNVEHNAGEALAAVIAAQLARDQATVSAGDAEAAMEGAQSARDAALAYAQAAQAAAGVPTPAPSTLFAADASGVAGWRLASAIPAFQAKADKDGAVVTRMVSPYVDLGDIAANGTAAINVQAGSVQRFNVLGNYTVAFANLPAGVVSAALRLRCEGLAGRTGDWGPVGPNGGWRKADGTLAATPSAAGIVFKSGAPTFILVMIDNGSKIFVVMQ